MSAYFVVPEQGSVPPANAAVLEVTVHVDLPSHLKLKKKLCAWRDEFYFNILG